MNWALSSCGVRLTLVAMGYQTDFVGYLQIAPPLNEAEIAWVNGISRSIYLDRRQSGLRIVDEQELALRAIAPGAPRGWSNWSACPTGCCLSYDGSDKANFMIPWLEYLMKVLLVPGAVAAGKAGFESFTFDHVLDGVVVGSRRDNRELYALKVTESVLEVEMLWPGRPEWSDYPPLAYQDEIDRFHAWVRDQHKRRTTGV